MTSKLPFTFTPIKPPNYYPKRLAPPVFTTTPSTLRQLMEAKFITAPFKMDYRGFISLFSYAILTIGVCQLFINAWGVV